MLMKNIRKKSKMIALFLIWLISFGIVFYLIFDLNHNANFIQSLEIVIATILFIVLPVLGFIIRHNLKLISAKKKNARISLISEIETLF